MNPYFFRNCLSRIRYVAIVIIFAAFASSAQRSSNWRVYRASDGLQDSVCTGISLSARGGIWVNHPDRSRLSWLDGYDVRKITLPGSSAAHIYEGRAGQIWSVYSGGVQEFKEGAWIRYPLKDFTAKIDLGLLPLRQGQVLVLTPERLLSFSSEPAPETSVIREAKLTRIGSFTQLTRSRDGGAWIAAKNGIGKFTSLRPLDATTAFEEHIAPADLGAENFSALTEDDSGVTCVARSTRDGKKIIVHWDQSGWTILPTLINDVLQSWRSNDDTYWELAPFSLVHLHKQGGEWHFEDELLAAQYYEAVVEPNGVFYVATSEGFYRYAPLIWQNVPEPDALVAPVALAASSQQGVWCTTATSLHSFDGSSWHSYPFPQPLHGATSAGEVLVELPNQRLLVGTPSLLFNFDPGTRSFIPVQPPAGDHVKMLGLLKDGIACFLVHSHTNASAIYLQTFDGQQFRPFVDVPANAGIGSDVHYIFVAQNGALWVVGDKAASFLLDGKWQQTDPGNGASGQIVAMIDVGQNKVWAAAGDRILQFNGKDWAVVQAGFDRVNGMFKARDGSIWVANNNGVHRAFKGDWIENGFEEGLSSLAVRQVIEDSQGHVWAATARSLNLYHPEADNDPPEAVIQPIPPESISTDGNVTVDFIAHDRWKQTFADRLLYAYRIDEQDWSPMRGEHSIHFGDLAGGKHFFQARAMDRNWNVDPKPALLEFFVPVPWFRETRLVLIGSAAALAVLFFAGLAFNRHRQLVRSYAEVEKIVDQRTRELEKANRELFQSQKMNALGTLAAGIAHDFNSILSIIKGSAQIIESNVEKPEKIRTRVERINTAVDQGAGIVKAMLGFSRSSDHQVTHCDLNHLMEETIRLLGDRFQRDVEVKLEPAPNLRPVCVVQDFVQQIVLNFILNAADAMPASGKIVVSTRALDHLPADMALSPEPAAHYACVEVQDFGAGIAPDIMPRIFEPFFSTKSLSTKRGTGLGLSMAYELAKEMKCGLAVRSTVGEGSTFTLIVPVNP